MYGILDCRRFISFQASQVVDTHLCNVCNVLFRKYGRYARLFANYDSALISLLTYAQLGEKLVYFHKACFHTSQRLSCNVADEFASSISVYTTYLKIRDNIYDNEWFPISHLNFGVIKKKAEIAINNLEKLGFPAREINKLIDHQKKIEYKTPSLVECMEATEIAASKIFSHTAVLSNQISNQKPMGIIGKHIGRIIYVLDNYIDLREDLHRNSFNPFINELKSGENKFSLKDLDKIRSLCAKIVKESLECIILNIKKVRIKTYQNVINEILTKGLYKKISSVLSKEPELNSVNISFKLSSAPFFITPFTVIGNQDCENCEECCRIGSGASLMVCVYGLAILIVGGLIYGCLKGFFGGGD